MERKNYFEILGIEFDPPEKKPQVIKKAIENWEKRTQDMLANETIDSRRKVIMAELDLKADMEKTLADNKSRNLEAKALKEKRVSQLEQLIEIMRTGETGTLEVTGAQIRNVSLKLKLSQSTVEDVYVKKSFVVQKRNQKMNLNDVFISKTTADKVSGQLSKMRSMSFPQFDWTGKVNDMFDFACFYSGGKQDDLIGFRRKKTSELLGIMESGAAKYAIDLSEQGHLLQELFTAGTTQIFNSEENRKKYSQTLEREKLAKFFALLKTAPENFKKDRYFAESCIRTIQKHFPDYNLALALYNQEAGLLQDPYEPMEALIRVVCASCKTPAEFRTHEEAERGQCAVCGAKLYVKCPSCGKKAPASADRCACGFQISELQFFEDYCRAAQMALTELDFPEAEKQLSNAKLAHPGHPSLAPLESQIKMEKGKYEKPLNDLDKLIGAGMYSKAQAELVRIAAQMPKLRLDSRRKKIMDTLDLAQKRMPPAMASPADRANRCMEILQTVKDFKPAIDMLQMIPPRPPQNLSGSARDDGKLSCTLSWSAAGDKGVTYQVVRKRDGMPNRPADGDILARDLETLEFKDTTLLPGVSYGYAVFACRYGAYSPAATCEVENFSELDAKSVRAYAENGVCHFIWALPANCIGVRIIRRKNALPMPHLTVGSAIVADRVQANFDDVDVENGTDYGYRLQCIYPDKNGFKYSTGLTYMLRPDAPPESIRNIRSTIEGRTVTLSWYPPDLIPRSVVVREAKGPGINGIKGQDLPASDINTMLGTGRVFANTNSGAKKCKFDIPANSVVSLAVITFSGSRGIVSDVIQASSVERCEIDKSSTRVEGDRLIIHLSNLPKNLERLYYTMAKKVDSRIPYATIDDAKNGHMQMVTVSDYVRDGMIVIERVPQTDLYITVIGQHKMHDSSVVYSPPAMHKVNNNPKQKISYQMAWGGGFFGNKAKNARLIIRTTAEETPEMRLICRMDGHIPMHMSDPSNIVLHTLPESDHGLTNGEYVYSFPDSTWASMAKGAEMRLMIDDEAALEFDVLCDNIKNLKVP